MTGTSREVCLEGEGMKEVSIPVSKVLGELKVTVRVTGIREYRVRLWVAARLVRLANWIMKGRMTVRVVNETDYLPDNYA